MRRKLVQSDLVDCVIGLGPNLFFNAPMEACIVICRTKKSIERRGKVLFINAVKEVTRKNAQSYLEDSHIAHIVSAYHNYVDEENYAKLVTLDTIEGHDCSLNIPLYARCDRPEVNVPIQSIEECVEDWMIQRAAVQECTQLLADMIAKDGE